MPPDPSNDTAEPAGRIDGRPPTGYLTKAAIIERISRPHADQPLIEWGTEVEREVPDLGARVNSWFCDLRLGRQVYISTENAVTQLAWKQDICIKPGQFALLITEETVNIPGDLAAFISLRFRVALRGLINISGRHVDPRFSGKLLFSVYNAGTNSVVLRRGDPIFMITFAHLDGIAPERANPTFGRTDSIGADQVELTMGTSASLPDIDQRVHDLELKFKIFVGILSASAVLIAGTFFTWLVSSR